MAKKFVNLDAMIPRADFAVLDDDKGPSDQNFTTISLRDFQQDAPLLPTLRKPDFQRETNHWNPDQVASLIQSFIDGDLIPSVILWHSPTHVFVIDGGHRLSALRAWVDDDYGDGPLSLQFFGLQITDDQKKAASTTRKHIDTKIGSWKHWLARNKQPDLPEDERIRATRLFTRAIPVQWVVGDADKAEASFYKINTQGTPLDAIEELLIRNRVKPAPISARSIIRAGMGHKYWSRFSEDKRKQIEDKAREIYQTLFQPEIDAPIKTLDLPLGGVAGVRNALELLTRFLLVANRGQDGLPAKVADQPDDEDGELTIETLDKALTLTRWMTGDTQGSLGLHPAVYFYSPTGRHNPALFMAMAILIARKLANNDRDFFKKFTECRGILEELILKIKPLIMTIILKTYSSKRSEMLADMFDYLITETSKGREPTEQEIVDAAGVSGKIIVGHEGVSSTQFSTDTKSAVFLKQAITSALRCPVCNGYLDSNKSVSYDHILPKRAGGLGNEENCQLTHPYCNQSIKNMAQA